MRQTSSDTDWDTPCPVFGSVVGGQDWQPVLKKVEARLGGWRARMLSRGGRLVLVKAVLSGIPTYFMSVFRMPSGVRRQLKGTMRSFSGVGQRPRGGGGGGGALVAWTTVCRPLAHGGLGIRHIDHTNMTLLSKWVVRVMESSRDMVSTLLREAYGHSLDWSVWTNPRRGDSLFVASLQGIFLLIRPFCKPQLRDGALYFWEDDRSGHRQLGAVFPRLYTLAPDTAATVWSMWTGAWISILFQALSDQRLAEVVSLQVRLANLRSTEEIKDAWRWCHSSFSAGAV